MSNRTPPETTTYVDAQERTIVRVTLSNGKGYSELMLSDYERIVAAGFTGPWYWNSNGQTCAYVRVHHDSWGLETAARLIARAGAGQCVRYKDGNRCNLRPENLLIVKGRRAQRDFDFFMAWHEQFAFGVPA
jgi:hypothetical protein